MVTTIVLLFCFSIAFLSGGLVAIKSVQLGLRWQIQTAKQEAPTLEVKNPIQPIVEAKQEKEQIKAIEEQTNILYEWVNGPQESR
jgi:hypothetical protein